MKENPNEKLLGKNGLKKLSYYLNEEFSIHPSIESVSN